MGQYYCFAALDSHNKIKAFAFPTQYNQGLKLMEFSYIGNNFMGVVESLINIDNDEGRFAHSNIVFGGDYADKEGNAEEGKNICQLCKSGDIDSIMIDPKNAPKPRHYRYLINETKKVFFDMDRVKRFSYYDYWGGKKCFASIHPLSILCCEGNGRGNGDFNGHHKKVGAWSRDVVVTSDNMPNTEIYSEVFYHFKE